MPHTQVLSGTHLTMSRRVLLCAVACALPSVVALTLSDAKSSSRFTTRFGPPTSGVVAGGSLVVVSSVGVSAHVNPGTGAVQWRPSLLGGACTGGVVCAGARV